MSDVYKPISNLITESDSKYLLNTTDTLVGTLTVDGNATVGAGGTTTHGNITIDGGTSTDYGAALTFSRNGSEKAHVGLFSEIVGGTSNALCMYSADELYLYSNTDLSFMLDWRNSVGIGTSTVPECAKLDITSTTKGLLLPRMTTAQRDAIPSPVAGLFVFVTDNNAPSFYTGSAWS